MPVPDVALLIFVAAVVLSYVYAFVGGFTDAANAIATAVGTRASAPARRCWSRLPVSCSGR